MLFRRVHHGKGRAIYPGQKIHASVAFKNRKYTPTAVFRGRPDPAPEWEELIGRGPTGAFRRADGWQGLLEMDLFDLDAAPINRAIDLLASGHLPSTNTLHILNRLGFLSSLGKFFEDQLLVSSDVFFRRRCSKHFGPNKR